MIMSKIQVTDVEVGSQIKIGGRVYQITKKVTNVGAFGDYVSMSLYDIARDFWVKDQTFQSDAKVFVVFKSSGKKW
jgi:translation elongation factor P/translation initiation factor 5A